MAGNIFSCNAKMSFQKCKKCKSVMKNSKKGSKGVLGGYSHDTITLMTLLKVIFSDVS